MKKVVIIGGGFAGSVIAKSLENQFGVTLIDTKDYFEFTPGILRTLVEPEHRKHIQARHKDYLKKTNVLTGKVLSVTEKEVITQNKKIKFDYLAICSGSKYRSPIKEENVVLANRASILESYHKKVEQCKNVLIIGGGFVGVELAAEICTKYLDKKVTIVQFNDRLMERGNLKASDFAYKFLTKKGVRIIFNEAVIKNKGNVSVTNKGTKLNADLTFICTGILPNSEFMKKTFADKLSERGGIKVNPYLQLEGHPNIFVAGDVNSVAEEKTAQNAEEQAKIVVKNIKHWENNEYPKEYKSLPRVMVVSLGKNCGILTYKDFTLTGFLPGVFKRIIEWKIMQGYL